MKAEQVQVAVRPARSSWLLLEERAAQWPLPARCSMSGAAEVREKIQKRQDENLFYLISKMRENA